uniref:Uncharacterized protein n=1 Tax=Anguilla anguilla TaxID=7936 RepID=A0A0E9PF53_ANGAN
MTSSTQVVDLGEMTKFVKVSSMIVLK